jgi:hypothetical protein
MVKDSNWAIEMVSDEDGQRHLFSSEKRSKIIEQDRE